MLSHHPFFELVAVTAVNSVGKRYGEVVRSRVDLPISSEAAEMVVMPTEPDAIEADVVFSPLPTDVAGLLEPKFAEAGFRVVTDASPHRMDEDVPLIVPEVNPDHLALIDWQRRKRTWKGFLVATPNCTAAGLALLLKPIHQTVGIRRAFVTTFQAVSGAGYPGVASLDIIDNVIPYIRDEEEKVEAEPRKMLGAFRSNRIEAANFQVSAMCHRVATTDGHLESVYIETEEEVDLGTLRRDLAQFKGEPQNLKLPTAPERPIMVTDVPDRPQVKLDRNAGSVPGMSIVVGRIREGLDRRSARLTFLSHNLVRGAAGSTILAAELLERKGFLA
jgi:aspartate-semialdehyde dehydrogenase